MKMKPSSCECNLYKKGIFEGNHITSKNEQIPICP